MSVSSKGPRRLYATAATRPEPAPTTAPAISPRRRWLGFAALMVGLFTLLSASTSVNTALPVLEHDLHANLSQVEWLVDSYFLTFTVFLTTFGRFGDVFGRKRMFLTGAVVFAAGSVGSALSRDINVLIAFRALTGLGPAMMMPATLSLITNLFPLKERGLPMGLWGSLVGVAIGVGPVIGGLVVNDTSWEWLFWINTTLAIASIVMGLILLPSRSQPVQFSGVRSLDPLGIIFNAGFLLSLSYALVEGHARGWSSPLIVGLFVSSAVLLVLFVVREMSAREPMLDFNLFRNPAFSAGILVAITLSFGLLGIFVYMPLFLQNAQHHDPLRSGLTVLPLAIFMALAGPFGGLLASRARPHWPIATAMLLFSVGMFWLAHLSVSSSWQGLVPPFVMIGIGLGIASATINNAVMAAVPRQEAGAAAGVVTTVRQLGSVLGIAVLGVVLQEQQSRYLSAHPHGHGHLIQDLALTHAMNDTFLVCAVILALGALAAFGVRQRRPLPSHG